LAVAPAGHLPTALTPLLGTRPKRPVVARMQAVKSFDDKGAPRRCRPSWLRTACRRTRSRSTASETRTFWCRRAQAFVNRRTGGSRSSSVNQEDTATGRRRTRGISQPSLRCRCVRERVAGFCVRMVAGVALGDSNKDCVLANTQYMSSGETAFVLNGFGSGSSTIVFRDTARDRLTRVWQYPLKGMVRCQPSQNNHHWFPETKA
jgi:hypothetical protein